MLFSHRVLAFSLVSVNYYNLGSSSLFVLTSICLVLMISDSVCVCLSLKRLLQTVVIAFCSPQPEALAWRRETVSMNMHNLHALMSTDNHWRGEESTNGEAVLLDSFV